MDIFDSELIDGNVFIFSRYEPNALLDYLSVLYLDFNYTHKGGVLSFNEYGLLDIPNRKIKSDNYISAIPEEYVGGNQIRDELAIRHLFTLSKKKQSYKITDYGKNLYMWIGKTNFSDMKDLLDFCQKWGLPTGDNIEKELPLDENSDRSIALLISDLSNLRKALNEYKNIFDQFIKVFIEEDLHWYVDVHPEGIFWKDDGKRTAGDIEEFKKMVDDDKEKFKLYLEHVKRRITYELEKHLTFEVQLRLNNVTKKSQIYISFNDLIEISYYYLGNAIQERAEVRKCEYCDNYFEVTDNRQRFCPPPPTHKRSICETAYNNKKKREQVKNN